MINVAKKMSKIDEKPNIPINRYNRRITVPQPLCTTREIIPDTVPRRSSTPRITARTKVVANCNSDSMVKVTSDQTVPVAERNISKSIMTTRSFEMKQIASDVPMMTRTEHKHRRNIVCSLSALILSCLVFASRSFACCLKHLSRSSIASFLRLNLVVVTAQFPCRGRGLTH